MPYPRGRVRGIAGILCRASEMGAARSVSTFDPRARPPDFPDRAARTRTNNGVHPSFPSRAVPAVATDRADRGHADSPPSQALAVVSLVGASDVMLSYMV